MLTIELVPSTSWYDNLRSLLPKDKWDHLRRACYRKAKYRCEICGGRGPQWPVECHEIWEFDDAQRKQILRGLIALCPQCHAVKHIGLAGLRGKKEEAEAHLAKVNGWTISQAREYIAESFRLWERRSRKEWDVDISWAEQLWT